MILRVEGAEGYKGTREFVTGTKILDVTVPVIYLPETVDASHYVPYRHRFPSGELYVVDVSMGVQDESLLVEGLLRKRTADAPKQTIVMPGSAVNRPWSVYVRHENIPYPGSLKFELPQSSQQGVSKAVEFVKKHYYTGLR